MAQPESRKADELDLTAVKAELRERLERLQAQGTELKRPPERGAAISFGKRIGDGTTEAIGRITEVGVADSLDAIELRIVRALEKLDEGTYGACDICGEAIPAGRLRIAPESNLCVRDAAAQRL